ncbi:MAG: hypothetical protein J0M19_05625 [Sphingomonadales bacterium]|nr:hypothetical protein [Sphingomonadales bacterium]
MPKDENGVAKHIMGPYEKWVLGLGRKYLKKPPQHGKSPAGGVQYAAFATFSSAVTSGDVDPQPASGQKFQPPRFPTIWAPDGEQAKYTAFPLLVQVSNSANPVAQQSDIDAISAWHGIVEQRIRDRAIGVKDLQAAINVPISLQLGFRRAGPDGLERRPITDGDAEASRILRRPEPGCRLNEPIAEDTLDTEFKQQPVEIAASTHLRARQSTSPKIVVMAVIDDGIAFAHANFREHGGGLRIESCWLQSAKPDPQGAHSVAFGRELFAKDIDDLLAKAGNDEAAVYAGIEISEADKAFGNPWRRFSTHGTHVLDIAAGHRHGAVNPNWPVPEEQDLDAVRIITVQLPSSAIANTAGFGKEAYVLSAFHHIFQRADEVFKAYKVEKAEDQGLIVNFSFGITAGPDDGTNPVAAAIDELVMLRRQLGKPTYVFMPAGNTFSSALYGEITAEVLKGKEQYSIPWRVQPNSRTSSHLELWFEAPELCTELEVFAPDGQKLAQLILNGGQQDVDLTLNGAAFGLVSYSKYSEERWHAVVSLAPTEPEDSSAPAAPAGLWQVHLNLKASIEGDTPLVRCRIQRNDSPFGYWTGARQSYFDDPVDNRFGNCGELSEIDHPGAFVRRFGSLNGWAINNRIWIVGGIVKDSARPSRVSAAGRLTPINGDLAFVDVGAPSDDFRHLPGRLAAGTMSGSLARISGTSVASPYAARWTALTMLGGDRPQSLSGLKTAIEVQGDPEKPPHTSVRLGKYMLT